MRFGLLRPTPAVRNLLLLMGLSPFVLMLYHPLVLWAVLTSQAVIHGQLWRVLTYLVAEPICLGWLFNLVSLLFLGPSVESDLGSTRFYKLFIGCGVLGGLGIVLGAALFPDSRWMTPVWGGADLSIIGMAMAFSFLHPYETVQLILVVFPIPIQGCYLGPTCAVLIWLLGGCSLAGVLAVTLMSYLMVRRGWWLEGSPFRKSRRSRAPKSRLQFLSAPAAQKVTPIRPQASPQLSVAEREVDRILDKLRDHGISSLSSDERATLDSHSHNLRQRDGM